MKHKQLIQIIIGGAVALSGTILMLILLQLNLVGPEAIENDQMTTGGTILFIFLYIFLLLGLWYGLKLTKKANQDELTFTRAFKVGSIISLSTAVFAAILTIGFYEMVYPSYNDDMVVVVTKKMQESGLHASELQEKVMEQKKYYSTAVQAQFAFIGNLITGLAFTTLLGLFLKTKSRKTE
ncbi:MAG: DUF4199 domain-containing protein [Roseivirga sp.]|nr:DUF4199 domain-containing protein [Roseivirga sp.]